MVNDDRQRKIAVGGEKPVAVSLCLQQIRHGMPFYQTRATSVRSRRPTIEATVKLNLSLYKAGEALRASGR
jgi:hypothetical protein